DRWLGPPQDLGGAAHAARAYRGDEAAQGGGVDIPCHKAILWDAYRNHQFFGLAGSHSLASLAAREVKGCDLLENPQVLALCASFLFGLALVLTQFGLRHMPPSRGASVSIPASAVLLSALAPFMLDWNGWDPRGALIFVLVGLLFPATVTLLTFEANRRLGPSVSGALSNLTPLFAVVVAAFLFNEVPRPLQALGIAMIVIGVITLSVNRDWLGTRWHLGAILLPIGIAGIRGLTHPITKLGLALWPSPFAAGPVGYLMSSLVVTGVAVTGKHTLPSGNH